MSDNRTQNPNAKALVLGDGVLPGPGSTVRTISKRHVAVRLAILRHREGDREPLHIPPEELER